MGIRRAHGKPSKVCGKKIHWEKAMIQAKKMTSPGVTHGKEIVREKRCSDTTGSQGQTTSQPACTATRVRFQISRWAIIPRKGLCDVGLQAVQKLSRQTSYFNLRSSTKINSGFRPAIVGRKEYELSHDPSWHTTSNSVSKDWDRNSASDVRLRSRQLLLIHGCHH